MSSMAGRISMGARREVVSAVTERYRSAKRAEKGRMLDALCATTGWHRKHAVRALRQRETVAPGEVGAPRERRRRYDATIKDALTALWEASDRVCGKRLKVMIPTLLPALEQHGRLKLGQADRDRVLAVSAATIDRLLGDVKVAASGGKRRRAGFYSAIRREVPIRTLNDWNSPPPGFCEVDMVAHGGTSVAGSFIQTLTMVDVATGWTECLPLVTRDGSALPSQNTGVRPGVGPDGFDQGGALADALCVLLCGRFPRGGNHGKHKQQQGLHDRAVSNRSTILRWTA
jgi:hypothetical protein